MSTFRELFGDAASSGCVLKRQEFLSSGVFTPTQALLDAGGLVHVFMHGGGGGGGGWLSTQPGSGGGGAELKDDPVVVTSLTPIAVTIGSGGPAGASATDGVDGGASSFGSLLTARGGKRGRVNGPGGACPGHNEGSAFISSNDTYVLQPGNGGAGYRGRCSGGPGRPGYYTFGSFFSYRTSGSGGGVASPGQQPSYLEGYTSDIPYSPDESTGCGGAGAGPNGSPPPTAGKGGYCLLVWMEKQ